MRAAAELVSEGKAPSMPEAADRALVSVATAYRYFSSAEDLWWEASNQTSGQQSTFAQAEEQIEAAGRDPQARLEALIRSVGFQMIDDRVPSRRIAKSALDGPVRQGRRNQQIRNVIVPLEARLTKEDLDRIAHALALVISSEATISLTDAVGFEASAAKAALLDAARWLLAGALAELTDTSSQ